MNKVKMTLTYAEAYRSEKMKLGLLYLIPRYNTISDIYNEIIFLGLEVTSRSHYKVKGHRRGGVCVL